MVRRAAGVLGIWLHRVTVIVHDTGLFRVVGIDWALYAAQTLLLRGGQSAVMYDLGRIDAALQSFVAYTTNPAEPLAAGPVVYPPVFAWLNQPLTTPELPVGFALWTLVNLVALGYLAKRTTDVLPRVPWPVAFLALLVTVPIAQGLIVGQPTVLLACAMAECYVSLRDERDFRGGLWLSVLLLKPQYGLLIGPILIWKRRWAAVGGAAMGGLTIAAGRRTRRPGRCADAISNGDDRVRLVRRRRAHRARPDDQLARVDPVAAAEHRTGEWLAAHGAAGHVTVAPVAIWRGPWRARSAAFPAQLSVTLLATILANYHSHVHGAALLAVPLAATLAQPLTSQRSKVAILVLAFAPTLLIVAIQHWLVGMVILQRPLDVLIWSPLVQLFLVATMVSLLLDVLPIQLATRAETSHLSEPGVQVT